MCEVRGKIINKAGDPLANKMVEFLPSKFYFVADGATYPALGAKRWTDEDGCFRAVLTRTDLTGVQYLTRGAVGNYLVQLNGPGPHLVSKLVKGARRAAPLAHDS